MVCRHGWVMAVFTLSAPLVSALCTDFPCQISSSMVQPVDTVAILKYFSSNAGLEIRVVLWPQSTRTSGGPPDCATWWSGGLLETFNH